MGAKEASFWEKHQFPLSLGLLGLILVGLGILGTNFWQTKDEGIEIITEEEVGESEVFVDIQGAIKQPGLYQLAPNSRVNDLLIKAGGLSAEADREWVAENINLAQKLTDGAKLYIPKQGESPPSVGGTVAGRFIGKININTASQAQLESLPGIGPAYAQRIISNRPYQQIEDLLKVAGIGPKTLEKIKDQVTCY